MLTELFELLKRKFRRRNPILEPLLMVRQNQRVLLESQRNLLEVAEILKSETEECRAARDNFEAKLDGALVTNQRLNASATQLDALLDHTKRECDKFIEVVDDINKLHVGGAGHSSKFDSIERAVRKIDDGEKSLETIEEFLRLTTINELIFEMNCAVRYLTAETNSTISSARNGRSSR